MQRASVGMMFVVSLVFGEREGSAVLELEDAPPVYLLADQAFEDGPEEAGYDGNVGVIVE